MDGIWQDWVALGIVAVAAAWLLRRAWRLFGGEREGRCGGGCAGCPTSAGGPGAKLVALDLSRPRSPRN